MLVYHRYQYIEALFDMIIIISMLLSINCQREALQSEMRLLAKVTYKLNNQMRHFKELNQLKIILRLTSRHLQGLKTVQKTTIVTLSGLDLSAYLRESQRIKNYIIRKGQQVRELLMNTVFMSFALIVLGCLAKIKFNIDQIQSKLKALERIITQMKKKGITKQ